MTGHTHEPVPGPGADSVLAPAPGHDRVHGPGADSVHQSPPGHEPVHGPGADSVHVPVAGHESAPGPSPDAAPDAAPEVAPAAAPDVAPDAPTGPRIVQRGLYADELQVGATYEHRPGRTISEADNVLFSTMTMNPQALHLDAAWSETTEFGQRLVNSMFTLATVVGASVAQITQGTLVANLGFGEISFPHPLHHGDTLYSETTVLGVRASRSRPGQSVVSLVHTGRNQHGEVVVRAARSTLMHDRPAQEQQSRSQAQQPQPPRPPQTPQHRPPNDQEVS